MPLLLPGDKMPSEYLKNPKGSTNPLPAWPCRPSELFGSTTTTPSPEELPLAAHTVPTLSAEVHSDRLANVVPVEKPKTSESQSCKLWRPFEASCSHPQPHRAFRCFCGSAFARNEELTRHLRIHSGQRPFECNQCGRRFGRKDHRDKHLKTHLRNEYKRIHRCPVGHCPGRYTRTDALNRHMLAAHGFRRPRKRMMLESSAKDQEVPALSAPTKRSALQAPPVSATSSLVPQLPNVRPAQIRAPRTTAQLHTGREWSTAQALREQPRTALQIQRDLQGMIFRNEIYSRSHLELMSGISAEQLLLWQRWL